MRGSAVFLAVFAVASCSAGVSGAHFVRSGITGYGTGRGNEDAPGIEDGAFGDGENDGRRIGERSNFGHDIAKRAAFRSYEPVFDPATGVNDDPAIPPGFLNPILPPKFPISVPPPPIVEVPPPVLTRPIFAPRPSTKPWYPPPFLNSRDLPLSRAVPRVLERGVRPLPALKFLPPSEVKDEAMKIISRAFRGAQILPAFPPELSPLARSQDFYRSELKNRRGRYSGLRSYSPSRSSETLQCPMIDDILFGDSYKYRRNTPSRSSETLQCPIIDDILFGDSYKYRRNTAPLRSETEENFSREIRSAVVKYLVHLWNKVIKWFKPGSDWAGGMGGLPPKGEIGGGKEAEPGLPEEHEVHTEPPPEEQDDVIIVPVRPPVDDGAQIIHLAAGEDAPETAEDSPEEGGSYADEDYYEPFISEHLAQTNWEAHHTRTDDDDTYVPSRHGPMALDKSMPYSNWEARRSAGKKDVASKMKGTSAGTRRKNVRDDSDTLTDIFGRRAHD